MAQPQYTEHKNPLLNKKYDSKNKLMLTQELIKWITTNVNRKQFKNASQMITFIRGRLKQQVDPLLVVDVVHKRFKDYYISLR